MERQDGSHISSTTEQHYEAPDAHLAFIAETLGLPKGEQVLVNREPISAEQLAQNGQGARINPNLLLPRG